MNGLPSSQTETPSKQQYVDLRSESAQPIIKPSRESSERGGNIIRTWHLLCSSPCAAKRSNQEESFRWTPPSGQTQKRGPCAPCSSLSGCCSRDWFLSPSAHSPDKTNCRIYKLLRTAVHLHTWEL